jgi:hypothetical protein
MSEFEQDQQVAGLLFAAADEAATFIRPRGVDAVVRRVHQRRVRTAGVAAVVLVAVFAPLTVFGITGRHASDRPTGDHPSTSASASPSDAASPLPSGSPLPSDSPSGSAAPDGRISADYLRNATLHIPGWPKGFDDGCPTGTVKFTDGTAGNDVEALQGAPVYVDVDHDGAKETVILVSCRPQGKDYQVIALDRDTTGKVVTLGKVVGSAGNTGTEGSDIMTIWAIKAGDNGQVRVDVGEYRPCCEAAQASQHQWRTYGWSGNRFTQTGGPTTFGPNPDVTDLVITADPLTMTKQADGSWAGTLRVTIHNAAKFVTPGKLLFSLDVDPGWQAQLGSGCGSVPIQPQPGCALPRLGAGASRVVTVAFTAPAGALSTRCSASAYAVDANGLGYPDRGPNDNRADAQVIQG